MCTKPSVCITTERSLGKHGIVVSENVELCALSSFQQAQNCVCFALSIQYEICIVICIVR